METTNKSSPILTVSAVVIVLLALFVFIFGDLIIGSKPYSDQSSHLDISSKSTIVLSVPNEPYSYDGKGKFDPTADVSATDENGKNCNSKISYTIKNSGLYMQKEIIYTVTDANSRTATAVRPLILSNYNGLTLDTNTGKSLECDIADTNDLGQAVRSSGAVRADDGFGNDITKNITIKTNDKIKGSGTYEIMISIENFLGDKVTKTATLEVTGEIRDTPIVLTQSFVELRRGEPFIPRNYILSAYDPKYGDLLLDIKYRSNLNTSYTGKYYMNFFIEDYPDISPAYVSLDIVVTE